METRIEAKEITVGDLFSEQFIFKIPIYQRPLSWTEDNFDQLVSDLNDAIESQDEQYFLGSILLKDLGNKHYELVDGQQRLTALAILFATIRDSINDLDSKSHIQSYIYQKKDPLKGIPEVMRVISWEELKDLFKDYIYTEDGTGKFLEEFNNKKIKYADKQDPRYHLYEAVNTFYDKISDISDLEVFLKYLLNKVYLVYIKTSSQTSAFRLFNVLNTRGLPLTPADILKSVNLESIKDTALRDKYASIWRDLEEDLGREELNNVIGFVRTIKAKEKARLSMAEEYEKLFNKKGSSIVRGTGFFDLIKEMAGIYQDKILDTCVELIDKKKENRYKILVDLMRNYLPFSDWIPPIMYFYYKFRSDNSLVEFILKLEKKVLIEWAVGLTPTERITSSIRTIQLIEDNNDSSDVIKSLMILKDDENLRGQKGRFLDFTNQKEIEKILISKLDDPQFYSMQGGRFAKFILLRTDMEMWDLENFPGYHGTITVEHILPRNPAKNSEWVRKFSVEEMKEWVNKLGNLVLLGSRKNSEASNYDYQTKKDKYFRLQSTPFKITQEIMHYDDWNIKNLRNRHQELINTLKEIYKISNSQSILN